MSEEKTEVTIVLIKNYWTGYLQSLAWLAALVAVTAIGIWLESRAMQWMMAIFWMLSIIGWAHGERARLKRTPDEAIKEIQELAHPNHKTKG